MNAVCSLSSPTNSRYFLIAIALHAAILFYPLRLAIKRLEVSQPAKVMVNLVEVVAPASLAVPGTSQTDVTPKVKVKHQVATSRPERMAISSTSVAVAAEPAISATSAPAKTDLKSSSLNSPPSIAPARFDATYLRNPQPPYPAISRRLGEEGKVLLRVRVSPTGQSVTVDIEKSSNFMRLDEAARQAVSLWRFVPAKHGDEAVEATVIVPLIFKLDD